MAFSQRFFWYYVAPSAVAGGIWAAAPLPLLVLAIIIVALAAGQIWLVRTQLIPPPQYRQPPFGITDLVAWLAAPVISLSILAVGGCFALIGYAFVLTALGRFPVAN
jgi:uncharacterized iron-regulated membrane protein